MLALWSGLGYYARARNLHAAARAGAARGTAGSPRRSRRSARSRGSARTPPARSPRSRSRIPAAAVDGNVARVLARLFLVAGDPAAAPHARAARARSPRRSCDPQRPGDLNQALMELGATVCGKPAPACARCPVAPLCAARVARRASGGAAAAAARRRAARSPSACAVVRRGRRDPARAPPAGGLFGGLWAPPSAELAAGEAPPVALARTLRAAGAARGRVGEEVAACERTLTHRALTLRAFRCEVRGVVREGAALRFVAPDRLGELGVPAAVRDLLLPALIRPAPGMNACGVRVFSCTRRAPRCRSGGVRRGVPR